MHVVPVVDAATEDLFFAAPERCYGHYDWYRPERREAVRWTFDPARNPAFSGGSAGRWVAITGHGQPLVALGRLAAFARDDRPLGGLGFAVLGNDEVATALFETAEAWLRARGASGWEGPTHFGERDRFCGALAEGFLPTLPLENQNPPEDIARWAARGEKVFDLHTYRVDFERVDLERLHAATRLRGAVELRLETRAAADVTNELLTIYGAAFDPQRRLRALTARDDRSALADGFAGSRVALAWVGDRPAGFLAWVDDSELGPKGWGFAVDPTLRVRGVAPAVTLEAMRAHQADGWRSAAIAGIASYSTAVVSYMEKTIGATRERVHSSFRATWS